MSGSADTSCSMSAIGKIGVRSGGPAGCLVCGFSGGSGSPGRSAIRLTQCVGIASSDRRNFVWASAMRPILRRLGQVPPRLDAPAPGELDEPIVERPAVGERVALVVRRGALERHGAGVVAEAPD